MRNRYSKYILVFKSTAVLPIGIAFFLIILDLLFPLPEPKQFSRVILARDNTLLAAYLTDDDKWRIQTNLNEVSSELVKAILEKEDKWFYWHAGVNPFAIYRAALQNIFAGRRVSGASTITMQTARMLKPARRTYFNKVLEIIRSVQLEFHYSKDEILELYLSMLPYGGNIEGVKSASYIYFNRPPEKLSLSQSIILTVIPNNPNKFRLDKSSIQTTRMRNEWIKIFRKNNIFPAQDLSDAADEPVNMNRFPFKILAPHFCQFVNKKYDGSEIRTSIDISIQNTAENLLNNYIKRIRTNGISNGAILIVNNRNNQVIGYCGSYDFDDKSNSGQVNGVNALRSPGSALKPALYAAAFDGGILTPSMKLNDIPTDFNGYEPENFDLKFNGEVTASFALANSLNIPAVKLLQQYGCEKFISVLEKAGFEDIAKNKNSLGLSIILGGCGVKLEQLVHLYTAFAHKGNLYPLGYLKDKTLNEKEAIKLFTPACAYLIADILSSHTRPDFPNEILNSTNLPKIAWKTGTSFGKRDAWAIGLNTNYTIGVWLGNFDGHGAADLSGNSIAVPLLFDLFKSVDHNRTKTWISKPDDLLEREVCSETGMLPGENCSHTRIASYIKNHSPNVKCDLYKSFYVDNKETIQYCFDCLPDSGFRKVVYPFYKPELALWYLKNKIHFKRPPQHNINCQAKHSGDGPEIISLQENYEYYIEESNQQQLLLQAASDPAVKIHYWYIDNKFFRKSKPGEKLFFIPEKGNHNVVCLDDMGRKEEIKIKVYYY